MDRSSEEYKEWYDDLYFANIIEGWDRAWFDERTGRVLIEVDGTVADEVKEMDYEMYVDPKKSIPKLCEVAKKKKEKKEDE